MPSFVLRLDKPVGPTSHDMVAATRRALGIKRVGHTGTLDPFASGLLLLCVGNATRLAEYLTDLPKTYRAVARFDGGTATDDATGERVSTSDSWRELSEHTLRAVLDRQRGTIRQRPSVYSAKKIAGKRAYDLARRGEAVELEASEVTIYDLRIVSVQLPEVTFEVDCSSGTYVRAIARDVGEVLGTGGYLSQLRRTRIGRFDVADALAPAALADQDRVRASTVTMLDAVQHLARVEVTEDEERALRFGRSISRSDSPGMVTLVRADELIAMGASDGEHIKPKKVIPRD